MIGSHIRELYEIFLVHNARAEQDGNVITVTYMLKTYEYVSKYAFLDNGEVYYIGLVSAGPPNKEDLRWQDILKNYFYKMVKRLHI